jgi:RNA polymerase sigma-70 factor (ECF subfamily)
MAEVETPDGLRDALCTAWHHYGDALVTVRPALHRHCRRLTGNLWDSEGLVQDALVRPFAQCGVTYPAIRDPRAYLLRTATNVWIDTVRPPETEARGPPSFNPTVAPRLMPSASSGSSSVTELRDSLTRSWLSNA